MTPRSAISSWKPVRTSRFKKWIDDDGIAAALFSIEGICEIHRLFCELLPPDLLLMKTGKGDDHQRPT